MNLKLMGILLLLVAFTAIISTTTTVPVSASRADNHEPVSRGHPGQYSCHAAPVMDGCLSH